MYIKHGLSVCFNLFIEIYNDPNMPYQNKNAKGTPKEILNMVKLHELSIKLSIKLGIHIIIQFKLE
jgi:hypothetical protein